MTSTALVRRLLFTAPGVALVLAIVAALVAGIGTASPLVASALANQQLSHRLDSLSSARGDVRGTWVTTGERADPEDTWDVLLQDAEGVRAQQPEPLRVLISEAQLISSSKPPLPFVPDEATQYFRATMALIVDPALNEHVELISGDWPPPPGGARSSGSFGVVVLDETARRMSWEVGTVLANSFTVSGTYRVLEPSNPRWEYMPTATKRGGNGLTQIWGPRFH